MADNKPPLTEDEVGRMVVLVFGQMGDGGGPFWCYVSVKPSRYDEFMGLAKAKTLDLRTFESDGFGEVIVSGSGITPPPDVTKKVAFMFKVPIKELFMNADPKAVIAQEMARLKESDNQ